MRHPFSSLTRLWESVDIRFHIIGKMARSCSFCALRSCFLWRYSSSLYFALDLSLLRRRRSFRVSLAASLAALPAAYAAHTSGGTTGLATTPSTSGSSSDSDVEPSDANASEYLIAVRGSLYLTSVVKNIPTMPYSSVTIVYILSRHLMMLLNLPIYRMHSSVLFTASTARLGGMSMPRQSNYVGEPLDPSTERGPSEHWLTCQDS